MDVSTEHDDSLFKELAFSFENYCNVISYTNLEDFKSLLLKFFNDNNMQGVSIAYFLEDAPSYLYNEVTFSIVIPLSHYKNRIFETLISFLSKFSLKNSSSVVPSEYDYHDHRVYLVTFSLNTISLLVSFLRTTLFIVPKS